MKKKEREFIEKFAKRWHEKLRYWGGGYIGWLNVKRMLMIFLRTYKEKIEEE